MRIARAIGCFLFPVLYVWALPLALGADARAEDKPPEFGPPAYRFNGKLLEAAPEMEGSFALLAEGDGPQIALARPLRCCAMAVRDGEEAAIILPLRNGSAPFHVSAEAVLAEGTAADVELRLDSGAISHMRFADGTATLSVGADARAADTLTLVLRGHGDGAVVRWSKVRYWTGDGGGDIDLCPKLAGGPVLPTPREVVVRPILERELIAWDWRLQDGIETGEAKSTFMAATEKTLARGDALLADAEDQIEPGLAGAWEALRREVNEARTATPAKEDGYWEDLWLRVHRARRKLVLANPLAQTGPLLFVKQAPGVFSHQLTQNYGRYARPGGGVCVLEQPGESMQIRRLDTGALPQGSFMYPEVTHDGKRVIVAFCAADRPPENGIAGEHGRYYHLYEIQTDGSGLRPLTDGAFDDFSPKELPDGKLLFISTRRGGMHRCGSPGCEVYTLTRMNADGSGIQTLSHHETQEWDPSVLNDGRVIYTRWDYVDRNAVQYQQLWTTRPDGANPVAFYGNNTLNPVGVWEARAVPGTHKVMATAAAHHAMTAGSIILVDVTKGVDGPEALTRLTPDVPFPESEAPLLPQWRAPMPSEPGVRTPEMDRWPGQCYKSAYPLSEQYFLAAYSYDALLGEPKANPANMFGLYLIDAFGNKELLYRDLNISSLWPLPLRAREMPPVVATAADESSPAEGSYLVQNVYKSNPGLPPNSVKRLRIVQVLPKSTSGANNPPVGAANASPGKQVLGTVPVESDGSAYFRVPAGIPVAFQALDESGQAVQVMRSVTYLQPGEQASCVGCHEPRLSAPAAEGSTLMATRRAPSAITPGPDGSNPLSYPLLVQPVLDTYCVRCHSGEKAPAPAGKKPILLTGVPEGKYTASYNALVERVSFSAWGRGTFPEGNSEPLAQPGFFGAKGSPLMHMLESGHQDVKLSAADAERLITWMDANGLFYGTFEPADQDRQQRGERIAGPALQ